MVHCSLLMMDLKILKPNLAGSVDDTLESNCGSEQMIAQGYF